MRRKERKVIKFPLVNLINFTNKNLVYAINFLIMFAYSEIDSHHKQQDNWDRFPAKDGGTVTPLLKLQFSPDEVEPLNIVVVEYTTTFN